MIRGEQWVWILTSILSVGLLGCGESYMEYVDEPLEVRVEQTETEKVVRLSRSPLAVAAVASEGGLLPRRLQVGDTETSYFGRVADVVGLDDRRFAVLDRMEASIIVHDSTGAVESTFGGEGGGPGEFVNPWAMVYSEGHFVVWDDHPQRTFTVMADTGVATDVRAAPLEGDWRRHSFRRPVTFFNDYQHGPEDITRRIRSDASRDDWIQIVQEDENRLFEEQDIDRIRPESYIVRLQLHDQGVDTLFTLEGPNTEPDPRTPPAFAQQYMQPLFSSRPAVAAGAGWIAVGTGDSASVHVSFDDGSSPLRLRWTPSDQKVTEEHKQDYARWVIHEAVISDPIAAEQYRRDSKRQRHQGLLFTVELNDFAERVPEVTALWGGGRCLLIAGFEPSDGPFSESSRMVLVDVHDPEGARVVRVPEGRRVRDLHGRDLYTVTKSDLGEWLVEAYELPYDCGLTTHPPVTASRTP